MYLASSRNTKMEDHGDRFLNEFTEFIQKPVPMIFASLAASILSNTLVTDLRMSGFTSFRRSSSI